MQTRYITRGITIKTFNTAVNATLAEHAQYSDVKEVKEAENKPVRHRARSLAVSFSIKVMYAAGYSYYKIRIENQKLDSARGKKTTKLTLLIISLTLITDGQCPLHTTNPRITQTPLIFYGKPGGVLIGSARDLGKPGRLGSTSKS